MKEKDLKQGLRAKILGQKIYFFEALDSTNNCAKALASCETPEGAVVYSEFQTQGRGRMGRMWTAAPGENLLFTVILRPNLDAEQANLLAFLAAVSVAEAVESLTDLPVEVKWPNDLLTRGKKFCGILSEASFKGEKLDFVVIGIGINVNQIDFPNELGLTATSLKRELARKIDRVKLFQEVLSRLEKNYLEAKEGKLDDVLHEWGTRCTMFNREIAIDQQGRILKGVALRLARDGGLVLETDGKQVTVLAGDVTVLS
ncbi:MAG: biotin--[acetyl-CoA-carboxylase] ligase [Bacteroidota bacterium]